MLFWINSFVLITTQLLLTSICTVRAQEDGNVDDKPRQLTEKGNEGRRVFLGEAVKLPCVPPGAKYNLGSNVSYEWFRGGYLDVDPRHTIQPNGNLLIHKVGVDDSDTFICKAHVKGSDTKKFRHWLDIVSVAYKDVTVILQYSSEECKDSLNADFKKTINDIVDGPVCEHGKICSIAENKVKCTKAFAGARYEIVLTLKVKGKFNVTCTNDCPHSLPGPSPKEVRMSLHERLEDKPLTFADSSKAYEFLKIRDMPEKESCPSGFRFDSNLCYPCRPGSYLSDQTTCKLCPQNSYSMFFAAVECKKCPRDEVTTGEGKTSLSDCLVFDILAIITVVVIVILFFFIVVGLPCGICFFLYYRKTVTETGEEPALIQAVRGGVSKAANCIKKLKSEHPENEVQLSEVEMPLLAEEGFIVRNNGTVSGLPEESDESSEESNLEDVAVISVQQGNISFQPTPARE